MTSVPSVSLHGNAAPGLQMPLLGLGTWNLKEDTYKIVKHALGLGYRLVDTAAEYGKEADVGRAIQEAMVESGGSIKREDLFLASKLWNADHDHVRESCQASLERLGVEYLDLYLMHWPVSSA